jgi:hypothetical protein
LLANPLRKRNKSNFTGPAELSWTSGGLGLQILRENKTSPTLQARQHKVGLVRVSDYETGNETKISPTSRARQNKVGLIGLCSRIPRENETSPTLQAQQNKVGLMRTKGARP